MWEGYIKVWRDLKRFCKIGIIQRFLFIIQNLILCVCTTSFLYTPPTATSSSKFTSSLLGQYCSILNNCLFFCGFPHAMFLYISKSTTCDCGNWEWVCTVLTFACLDGGLFSPFHCLGNVNNVWLHLPYLFLFYLNNFLTWIISSNSMWYIYFPYLS